MKNDDRRASLRAEINQQTSRFPWTELLRFFAAGNVIAVDDTLDLVDVGVCVADDDKDSIMRWMMDGRIAKVSDAQAEVWLKADAALWTVVVKPWILVQERKDKAAMH